MTNRTDTAELLVFLRDMATDHATRLEELQRDRDSLLGRLAVAHEAQDRLAEVERERDELHAEVERLQGCLKVASEPNLTGIHFAEGVMHIGLEGGACRIFAEAFVEQFREAGATNYVECGFHHGPSGENFTVTLQRAAGKSPHRLRQEAEAERDELRRRITEDQVIEVAQALEQQRALAIVGAVAALPIGGADEMAPTAFQAGYQQACEEIAHRLRTEMWTGCLPPIDAPKAGECAEGGGR